MAKKRHGRGERRVPRRHHPARPRAADTDRGPHDQDLFQTLRRGLRSNQPLDLLATVSGLLEVTDPRSRDPFDRTEQRMKRADLVDSFIETRFAETTAALTAMLALGLDDVLGARVRRELSARKHPLPAWLVSLDQAQIDDDVWLMTHVLGDGDDYLLGVTLPTGDPLSALVYVDHNMGTIVKDAFLVPEPLEDFALTVGKLIDDPDQTLTRTDAASARAVVEAAIADGSRLYPPVTSDSWPMCRPLVEWMLRMLPAGGVAPEVREWSEEEIAAISDEFFASPYGAAIDGTDERNLLDSVLWFGTSYSTGDPWRWSAVTVEMLLADWFPRKVVADPEYLAKLPDVVRAYIRFCHARNDIRADLTQETLAAVDAWEPQYLTLIRSEGHQARVELFEALVERERLSSLTDEELALEYLAARVGGMEALTALDDKPLPDEEFDWRGVPEEIRPVVQAILVRSDGCADELFDVEHRTAMRRLLARAASRDPMLFRRKASPVRGAAALAWAIATANETVNNYRSELTTRDLLETFDITGSVSDRARTLLRAAGIEERYSWGPARIDDPSLLVSRLRRRLTKERDRITQER